MSFFGGQVTTQAGAMKITGKPYDFKHEKFRPHLRKIDSFVIHLPDYENTDVHGNPALYPVKTPIENMEAYLQIDKPDNKSGRKDFPSYPKLRSTEPAYAYYDQDAVLGGVYDQENFYFQLDTFSLDSLNNFRKHHAQFTGEFVSADIFPDLRDTLKVQRDTSLGFTKQTPEQGYPVYKGKGTYHNRINLSNKGLKGSGKVEYLPSTTHSQDITFYPDSMNAETDEFVLRKETHKGTKFPKVEGENLYTHWEPYNDEMYHHTKDEPFAMYDGESELEGTLVLTPSGIQGQGGFAFKGAEMESKSFTFSQEALSADSMSLKIESQTSEGYAFEADNVRGDVDIPKEKGTFVSNDKSLLNRFPENQYITRTDKFTWDNKNNKLAFESTTPEQPYFTSVNPKQDSLRFQGGKGSLDLTENRLTISKVEYIPVADAQIFPDSQMVYIQEKADMEKLLESKVKADTAHFYHDFYEANVDVKSRHKYKGEAKYDYVNESGEEQQIFFYELYSEPDTNDIFRTHATGLIEDVDSFELNPTIGYKGRGYLFAPKKYLKFDGYAQLQYDNEYLNTQWFNITDRINPHDLIFQLEEPHNPSNAPLFTGVHITRAPSDLYPTLLNQKQSRTHHDVFRIDTALLEHDMTRNHYKIGDSSKIFKDELTGQKYIFKPVSNVIETEGKYDLGLDYSDHIEYQTTGQMKHNLENETYNFTLLMSVDFFFDDDLLEVLANNLKDVTYSTPDIDYQQSSFDKAMAEMIGNQQFKDIGNQLMKDGTFEVPDQFEESNFLFTDLKMAWDTVTHSYRSTEPIGISFINGMPLHKKVDAYLEVGKERSGDFFSLYLEGSEGMEWYYFHYKKNMMYVFSSNQKFIDQLMEIPKRKRKFKGESGYTYNYTGSTSSRRANEFIKQMKKFQEISH
jgi:hypothetical protein